jgi:hypothetical protein
MFEAASATLAAVDLGAKADPASLLPIVPNGATAVVVVVAMAAGLIPPKIVFDALGAAAISDEGSPPSLRMPGSLIPARRASVYSEATARSCQLVNWTRRWRKITSTAGHRKETHERQLNADLCW